MMAGVNLSAAARRAATASTARKAVSCLRKPTLRRFNCRSIELEPVGEAVLLKGKKTDERHDEGPENFIADIEVVVGEAALLVGQDAVICILGRELRYGHPKGSSLLHALKYEKDTVSVLAPQFP